MILIDRNGIRHIERTPYNSTQDRIDKYNNKYGVGGWKWAEPICSYLSRECGYGDPLNKDTCRYCDGKCMRPKA